MIHTFTVLLSITALSATTHARHFSPQSTNRLHQLRAGGSSSLYERNPNYQQVAPVTLGDVDNNGYYHPSVTYGIPSSNRRPPPITSLIRDYFTSLHNFSPTLSYGTYASLFLFVLWQFPTTRIKKLLQEHFVCSRRNIRQRRYHSLLTSAFSHASLHHLAVNLYAFLTFGPSVKQILASQDIPLGIFVLSAALFGSWAFLAFDSTGMGSCIGLSGVTLALLAFDSLIYPSKELRMIVSFIPIHLPAYYLFLGLMGFSLMGVLGLLGGTSNVAHSTHLGGLLFGNCFYEAFRRGWIRRWNYQLKSAYYKLNRSSY
ncbi:hypothetical protein HJC23_005571 [Cyclotella cryptica]|uniref:Peptidase S54 rhomboid domain-containing protein n=1 Tax=Cyclotella cryptica TaxID=29204 RepID=A0ABD3PRD7_9STRA|eukprot:CCRYP_012480-RA/>CCRYP_012480-RA protein AED:0.03 eAED:0.02 QI:0/-1/0/1/-1/1/1/0/314